MLGSLALEAALAADGKCPKVWTARIALAARIQTAQTCKKGDTPKGIRIPVASVKGRCPRPLDDGGMRSLA